MNSIKICIDAGHGGYDPGAVGPGGTKEKDVTLVISLLLAEKLRVAGQEVILTREGDVVTWTPNNDLTKRCQIANNSKVDVFISIHANAATNPAATGTETYHHASSIDGKWLAEAVQGELVAALGLPNRGVKTANFTVLTGTNMPAILVELAFICNPTEERMLATPSIQEKMAQAIARGVGAVYGFDVAVQAQPVDSSAVIIKAGGKAFTGKLIGDTTYAPVRAVAEALGRQVGWDEKTRTVTIK